MSKRKSREESNKLLHRSSENSTMPSPILAQKLHGDASHINITREIQQEVRHFEGPLPPPETLAQYENIHKGLAERIVQMAEKEQAHRHEREKTEN